MVSNLYRFHVPCVVNSELQMNQSWPDSVKPIIKDGLKATLIAFTPKENFQLLQSCMGPPRQRLGLSESETGSCGSWDVGNYCYCFKQGGMFGIEKGHVIIIIMQIKFYCNCRGRTYPEYLRGASLVICPHVWSRKLGNQTRWKEVCVYFPNLIRWKL